MKKLKSSTPANYDPVYEAYRLLVEARENPDMTTIAIEEAIGYLGEALE